MTDVHVRVSGHTILEDVACVIAPGEHVAIVGPSGAGKSSLLHLLLGLHRPAGGELEVDGRALRGVAIARLRRQAVWIDPAVQLWNRSLLDNLLYGGRAESAANAGDVVEAADLRDLLIDLPHGLQTVLGEGGGLVSGGEGQRVRIGRGIGRTGARLVLLDEAFRGLDHEQRRQLLRRVRWRFADATLLCATHDIEDALELDRVIVIHRGRIVEDGRPSELAARRGSVYGQMLAAEREVLGRVWGDPSWRTLQVVEGRVHATAVRGRATERDGARTG